MSVPCSGSVAQLIFAHADGDVDRPALVYPTDDGYRQLTYRALVGRVAAVAAGLSARGVGRGDKVVVLVPMSPELYVTLLAVASLGAIAVFVEPASTPREIARVIRVTRPRAFVGIARAHVLRLLDRRVAAVPVKVLVGGELAARVAGAMSLAALEADHAGSDLPEVPIRADDPVLLTFSSGSTGTPKGAVRSHAFLAAQHASIERLVGRPEGEDDVHLSAFAIVLLSSLCAGQTAVIPRLGKGGVNDVDADELVELIRELGVNVISGSPAFIEPIVDRCRATGLALADVRRVVTGGAPVSIGLCEKADGSVFPGGALLVTYGSTEAEPIATIEATDVIASAAEASRAGAGLLVGEPDDHLELRLIAPTTRPIEIGPGGLAALEVSRGDVGEVVVCGDHVNKTYYRNPEAVRANKIVDERGVIWHRTGDVASMDERGRLWIVGRVADMVRKGSAVYHPAAVEAAAQALPYVSRAALIEGRGGETVLVVEAAGKPVVSEIVDTLASAGVDLDRVTVAKKQLPVDPRHRAKLDYPAIRRQYA